MADRPDSERDSTAEQDSERDSTAERGSRSREVVVPLRVYKTVIVFSTLFAVAFVVGGFIVLDVATQRATASLSEIDPVGALAGLVLIVAGATLYAFASRFRARGMGNAKERPDESTDNG